MLGLWPASGDQGTAGVRTPLRSAVLQSEATSCHTPHILPVLFFTRSSPSSGHGSAPSPEVGSLGKAATVDLVVDTLIM